MVLEGTLGIVTSHFLLDLLRERELLPGFAEGYGLIAADEQRHIAYGTWFLREAVAGRPGDGRGRFERGCSTCCRMLPRRSRLRARAHSTRSASSRAPWPSSASDALNRRLSIVGVPLEPPA